MSPILAMLVVLVAGQDAKPAAKPAAAATVTLTAELACLHCTFGEGDNCHVCLKVNDKTPVLLAGKAAKQFEEDRLSGKVVVAEGTLTLNKEKRLLLTSDKARLHSDKDKGKAPEKGLALIVGHACCGKCNLNVCESCTMAVKNATFPVILDGKLAEQHAAEGDQPRTVLVTGVLFLDKRGLLRIEAKKVEDQKK